MSGAPDTEEDRSVISIRTRDVWVPPEVSAVGVETIQEGPVVDQDAITATKMLLADLEAGKKLGIAFMTWDIEQRMFQSFVALPNTKPNRGDVDPMEASALAFQWAGGSELLKEDILNIAYDAGDYNGEIVMELMGEGDE